MRLFALGLILAIFGHSSVFAALDANFYKNSKKCYAKFYPNTVDEVVKMLEEARKNPALAKLDDYHSSMVANIQGTLPDIVFSMTKDATGKETIMISLGNLQGPWEPKDYPKYFEMFCKQAHPDKPFCAARIREKYDRWMSWLDSNREKLQPIVDRLAKDSNYDWIAAVKALKVTPDDSVTQTLGWLGFDETIPLGIAQGRARDENGGAYPVVYVGLAGTNKVLKYVTLATNSKEIMNPLFFTGIDEHEWNCYIQRQAKERIYLDGKPIC